MATCLVKKDPLGLHPADDKAAQIFDRIPNDEVVTVRIMRERSAKENRLYWQVIEKVADATGRNPQQLHTAVRVALGFVDAVRMLDGSLQEVPVSTADDVMTQDEAHEYHDAAFELLAEHLHMSVEELLQHSGVSPEQVR